MRSAPLRRVRASSTSSRKKDRASLLTLSASQNSHRIRHSPSSSSTTSSVPKSTPRLLLSRNTVLACLPRKNSYPNTSANTNSSIHRKRYWNPLSGCEIPATLQGTTTAHGKRLKRNNCSPSLLQARLTASPFLIFRFVLSAKKRFILPNPSFSPIGAPSL